MPAASSTCRSCQRRVVNAFLSLTDLSIRTSTRTTSRRSFAHLHTTQVYEKPQLRPFHTRSALWQDKKDVTDGAADTPVENDTLNTKSSQTASSDPPSSSSVPWYLQVETPTPPASSTIQPLLAAQEIPALPSDPPAILLPILKHLSISIGLDNLSILDLRDLSPPSALGANLLMILGTARSTKHLNTSADRFCRWLRSTYGLRPYADGLMGRNELKLKLRRKNRKLKLARSVGNTTAFGSAASGDGYDDGIGTGWICCNLGSVEGIGEDQKPEESHQETRTLSSKDQERILDDEPPEYTNPSDMPDSDFTYRGFGSENYAPRIVVQMFTEEKRLEMDLEGLWEARITRREEKKEKNDRVFENSRIEEEINGSVPGSGRIEAELRKQDLLKDIAPISAAGIVG